MAISQKEKDEQAFKTFCKELNENQKKAVKTIDGPVMVVAGPGTGKTQVLALRIGNILQETDTAPDQILCLTFTNSGVSEMRARLRKYIGKIASRVSISTFHSFAIQQIEKFYVELGFVEKPQLIDDIQAIALADAILSENTFEHIRTRANKALYFKDIKSLISLLKREGLTPAQFLSEIEKEIHFLETDESSVASKGARKGELKQDVLKKIDSLKRTQEIVTFYELYEQAKKEKNFLDYDDVLSELVRLSDVSEDAVASIREQFLYVLVDEHQDSSGVQNQFLKNVWSEVDQPNIFVVGDDRQLIYGFGGASLLHFESFKETFRNVECITLTDNYRSTQTILDTAEILLKSTLAKEKLISHHTENEKIQLVEAEYERDEIIRAGLAMKEHIENGIALKEIALLVPKNAQVKNAMRILLDMGIPVAGGNTLKLFELPESQFLISLLRALAYPESAEYIAPLFLEPLSKIPPLVAHQFLVQNDARKISLSGLLKQKNISKNSEQVVFDDSIIDFAHELEHFLTISQNGDVYGLLQKMGNTFLIETATDHETITRRIEIIRSFLHLVLSQTERNSKMNIIDFLNFIDRLEEYSSDIPLAIFGGTDGVQVMTLHTSKGLQFEFVWIAHVDEKNLLGKNGGGFSLPESIKMKVESKNEDVVKRQLYVAITRAKRFCTLSYSRSSYTGGTLELAHVIEDLGDIFEKSSATETENFIREKNATLYVSKEENHLQSVTLEKLGVMVKRAFTEKENKLAVTHLNNFFDCPWKWYMRNLLQLPEPKTVSLEFGNLVHGTLELILKNKIVTSEIDQTLEYKISRIQGFDSKELSRMKKDAENILLPWIENRLPEILENHESEKSLSYHDPEFEHIVLTGKIDLIEYIDDTHVRVTDFKTGTVKKKNEIEKETDEGRLSDYHRQLAMYSYLLKNTSGEITVDVSRLEFLEAKENDKGAEYKTQITNEDILKLKKDITDFNELILSGKWTERKCNFRPFKNGEICDYCKLGEIYKK